MRLVLFTFAIAACGDSNKGQPIDAAPHPDTPMADAAPDGPDPRGPATFTLTGGANALYWDDAAKVLYLTNDTTDKLLKFTDAHGVEDVATLPPETAGISLGGIVREASGHTLIANFGFGTQGTLFDVDAANTATALTGLDVAKRRIGIGEDSNGLLYESYFVGMGGGMQVGGVATVTVNGTVATEAEIAGQTTTAGFKKLVGLVATPEAVFVSDQSQKIIFKIAVPGNAVTAVGTVPSADILSIMPNGDLLTGGTGVHRLTQAGTATTIFTGFDSVRGTAYDPTLKRLFIINHSATVGTPDKLEVRPLDQ
jgi:hypothetical protein